MRDKYEISTQRDIIASRIVTSNYPSGTGYPEALVEYNILCWVLEEEPKDLNRIKNDHLLVTLRKG